MVATTAPGISTVSGRSGTCSRQRIGQERRVAGSLNGDWLMGIDQAWGYHCHENTSVHGIQLIPAKHGEISIGYHSIWMQLFP